MVIFGHLSWFRFLVIINSGHRLYTLTFPLIGIIYLREILEVELLGHNVLNFSMLLVHFVVSIMLT